MEEIAHIGNFVCGGALALIGLSLLAVKVLSRQASTESAISSGEASACSNAFFVDAGQSEPRIYTSGANQPVHCRGEVLAAMCRRERGDRFAEELLSR